jgi:hypothetical protein
MPFLYFFDAFKKNVTYPLVNETVPVGRHSSNRVVLTGASVSRFHFRLYRLGSEYLIKDLGSRYGTFVNGKRVTSLKALRHGSWIGVGSHQLFYSDMVVQPPLRNADEFLGKVEQASPLAFWSPRQSCRVRIWWRLSHGWLGFGWNIRRS